MKKTLVLGASNKPQRYSYLAIRKLRDHGHAVIAVGKKTGEVADVSIVTAIAEHSDIDTITIYLNPINQKPYYDSILTLKPKRIIFNPGSENPELQTLAKDHGIPTLEACTLVMLSTSSY